MNTRSELKNRRMDALVRPIPLRFRSDEASKRRVLMRHMSGVASAPYFFENGLTPKKQGADAAPLRNLSLSAARGINGLQTDACWKCP